LQLLVDLELLLFLFLAQLNYSYQLVKMLSVCPRVRQEWHKA